MDDLTRARRQIETAALIATGALVLALLIAMVIR